MSVSLCGNEAVIVGFFNGNSLAGLQDGAAGG